MSFFPALGGFLEVSNPFPRSRGFSADFALTYALAAFGSSSNYYGEGAKKMIDPDFQNSPLSKLNFPDFVTDVDSALEFIQFVIERQIELGNLKA